MVNCSLKALVFAEIVEVPGARCLIDPEISRDWTLLRRFLPVYEVLYMSQGNLFVLSFIDVQAPRTFSVILKVTGLRCFNSPAVVFQVFEKGFFN